MEEIVEPTKVEIEYEIDEPVIYGVKDRIATFTLNRVKYHNAQNAQMLYALDACFRRACDDDDVKVIVLRGNGKHFSAGHDIGTPGRDFHSSHERQSLWYDHNNKPAAEKAYAREQELYLGMCRRWRDAPKPTIAMVHGGCIAGGLMLAWACDLIFAADDAFFSDPVLKMGLPGVEYFAHPYELNPRIAKEFLLLGERMSAARAYDMGMVNRVLPRDDLERGVMEAATVIAGQPRLALALVKQAVNHVEDLLGKRSAMDAIFHMHHFAHAQADLTSGDYLSGFDAKKMAAHEKKKG